MPPRPTLLGRYAETFAERGTTIKERGLLVPLLVVLLALGGCLPAWLGLDSGLFSDKPCKAPCWQNLTPGQSTSDDVDRFLEGLSTRDWPGRLDKVADTGCRSIRLTDRAGTEVNAVADLYVEDGKLAFVSSNPFLGPTLKQVINHFGSPNYFKAVLYRGFDADYYVLEIYYPAQGVAFHVSVNEEDRGRIKSNMRVNTIEYFPPGNLISYLTARYSCNMGQTFAIRLAQAEVKDLIQPWSGFGQLQTIIIDPLTTATPDSK
jgi:hypothetical protein